MDSLMMLKFPGKKGHSGCGLTALEFPLTSTTYLKTLEMGRAYFHHLNDQPDSVSDTSSLNCRWVLLEVIDKIAPGSVNWKMANRPPIKLPFKKVENCNQVLKIGKELKFSLVNIAGNDIVQGNKKLILGKLPVRLYLSNIGVL